MVEAYTSPTLRYIQLSSSANAATDVTYAVGFTTNQNGSASNIGGVVIEFCSNTPVIGDSCTAPAGLNLHAFTGDNTLVLANQSGITDFQKNTTNATANRLILSRTGGAASVNSGVAITVDLGSTGGSDGVTNPSTTNTSFYARILTYATQAASEAYTPTSIGSPVDAGGVALSTAAQITVTAKVPERLTFCVFTVDGSVANTCGTGSGSTAPSGTAVALGDTNGTLNETGPFVDKNAQYSIQTNATSGAAIRMTGGTLKITPACAETPGQNCSIDAIGATAASSAAGTEQFGFCTYQTTGSGLTPAAPYDHADCNTTTQTAGTGSTGGAGTAQFAYDNNNTDGTTSTFGDVIGNKTAGAFSTALLAMIGNISVTTEPGIYVTTLTFIATGTF